MYGYGDHGGDAYAMTDPIDNPPSAPPVTEGTTGEDPPFLSVDLDKTGAHLKLSDKNLTPRQRIVLLVAIGVCTNVVIRLLDWIGSHFYQPH